MAEKKKVYVVGHKNPDTDSICTAIAYANLKTKITGETYEPRRAGQLNEETQYVLEHFGVKVPLLLSDLREQIKNVELKESQEIQGSLSIRTAWEKMSEMNTHTIPITRNGVLEGVITKGDIAKSYMEVYDNTMLAKARTQYRNIAAAVEGEIVTGNEHGYFYKGKVTVAASSKFAFGTKLNIGGHIYTVEDRGGAVNGNKIDIFVNSHAEALQWGVRYLPVSVVN